MKKKLLMMMLAVMLLLVACGNADSKDTEANTQQTESQSTSETETLEADTEEETTHTHAYTEEITTEATCEADGVKTFTCECGDSYTEPIKAIGHDYKDDVTAPTCSEKGYTTHTCKTCGNAYTDTEVSATGHSYGKYTYNNDATYEKDGTETATCSTCGKKNTRTKSGTKLVKEEPEELPFELYKIYDTGDAIYFWDEPNDHSENGTAKRVAAKEQGWALASARWGEENCAGYFQYDSYRANNTMYFMYCWKKTN